MVGRGLLAAMKSQCQSGEGELQELSSFYINFRSLFALWTAIKRLTDPFLEGLSLFCKRLSSRSKRGLKSLCVW